MSKITKYINLVILSILTVSLMSKAAYAKPSEYRFRKLLPINQRSQKSNNITLYNFSISPDGSELYAIDLGEGSGNYAVYVVDTRTGKTIKKISMATSDPQRMPYSMAMAKDGKSLFVSAYKEIDRIDTLNKAITAKIETGENSTDNGIAITPDGSKVISADHFKLNGETAYVHIIDTNKNSLVNSLAKNDLPRLANYGFTSIAVARDGKKAYLLDDYNPSMAILDIATNYLQLNAISIPDARGSEGRMAINSTQHFLYLAEFKKDKLDVIDLNSNKLVKQIEVGATPNDVVITPDDTKVYIVNSQSDDVTVVNAKTNHVTKTIFVGYLPLFAQVSQDGKTIYVATFTGTVVVIDVEKDEVIKTINIQRI